MAIFPNRILTREVPAATVAATALPVSSFGGYTMRRRTALLAVPVLLTVLPANSASAACVSSSGITACPRVYTCVAYSTVTVTVVGSGNGTASCGGGTAFCTSFRVECSDTATSTSSGVLTCSSTGTAVATCTVTLARLQR